MQVHITVVVPPGADERALLASELAAQGARPIAEPFSVWFNDWDDSPGSDDGNLNNSFGALVQNYNPGSASTKTEPVSALGLLGNTHTTIDLVSTSAFDFAPPGASPAIQPTTRCPSLVRGCQGPQVYDRHNDVAWLQIGGCCTLAVTWSGAHSVWGREADMALNTKFSWSTGAAEGTPPNGGYDVETVMLHEPLHVVGLSHSNQLGSAVEPNHFEVRRSLHPDDVAGQTNLYPEAGVNLTPSVPLDDPTVMITGPVVTDVTSGSSVNFTATATDDDDDNTQ